MFGLGHAPCLAIICWQRVWVVGRLVVSACACAVGLGRRHFGWRASGLQRTSAGWGWRLFLCGRELALSAGGDLCFPSPSLG